MVVLQLNKDLFLRQIQLSDAEDIFIAINTQREYLGRWLPFVEFTNDIGDSRSYVESIVNVLTGEPEYVFTIQYKGSFAGLIGFNYTDKQNKRTEIGYWLCEQYQGKGIITHSVNALCEFAFEKQDINRIQINCSVENERSKKIPLRLGFKLEGVERDGELLTGNHYTDIAVYGKLKREWIVEDREGYVFHKQQFHIRNAAVSDIEQLKRVFKETILFINKQDYTQEELLDWASCGDNDKRWRELLSNLHFIVAENFQKEVVGFASISDKGDFHSLYIHKDYQRLGIASLLYNEIEKYAKEKGIEEITSEVSITAKPFFIRKGFRVYEVHNRRANQLCMKNYKMRKFI